MKADDPLLGREVRQYRIESRLGAGGMGVVYRAHDTRLVRPVALKFLPAHLLAQDEARERFLVEARAAAALEHPNVCTIHEVGETDESGPFIAMALYEGESLKDRIARGSLPVEDAVELASQIARGLEAARQRGIVHRDVKPGNVLVTPGGVVKLVDFGLAKLSDVSLTQPGATPGTLAYMSPEQLRGERADHRSDLWSLGVMLYEMLAGERPFRGPDAAILHGIVHRQPTPLRELRPEIPAALANVVDKLLRKEPTERYRQAGEVAADLAAALRREMAPARAAAMRGRGRRALLLGGSLAAVLLAGAIVLRQGAGDAGDAGLRGDRTRIAVLPFDNMSAEAEQDYFSDGITEDLLTSLSRIEGVQVISWTSAMRYKGSDKALAEIAGELGAGYVLRGSVRRAGTDVRIAAQLVDPLRDAILWADTYDREFTGIFQIQSEIAQHIAEAFQQRLLPADRLRIAEGGTENPTAYDLLLRGREYLNRPGEADLQKYRLAIGFFHQALEIDPGYARAYAGLSEAYRRHVGLSVALRRDSVLIFARRALELDPRLAEAAAALGFGHILSEDWPRAEQQFRRSLELDPNHAEAMEGLAKLSTLNERLDGAARWQRRAVEVDPLAARRLFALGRYLFDLGDLDGAEELFERAAVLAPDHPEIAYLLASVYLIRGDEERAEARMQALLAAAPDNAGAHGAMGRFLADAGRYEDASAYLDRFPQLGAVVMWRAAIAKRLGQHARAAELLHGWQDRFAAWERAGVSVPPRAKLHVQILTGNMEGALATLREHWRKGLYWIEDPPHIGIYWLDREPIMADLRDDPRFQTLLQEMRAGLDSMRARVAGGAE